MKTSAAFFFFFFLLISLWKISNKLLVATTKLTTEDILHQKQKNLECLFKVLYDKGNILAIGDSLTRGYVKEGKFRSYLNPYTNEMKRLLSLYGSKLPISQQTSILLDSGYDIIISNNISFLDFTPLISEMGQNGETTEFLLYRLPEVLKNQSDLSRTQFSNHSNNRIRNRNFSFVIILSGTNDLGYKINADFVVNKLIAIHRMIHDYGAFSVAVTLPPLFWPPIAMSIRATVNERLRQYATEAGIALLDLGAFFDRNQTKSIDTKDQNPSKKTCPIYIEGNPNDWMSSDKVHLSKFGYDQLGKYLFLTLIETCIS